MAAEGGPTPAAGNPPLKAKDLESARLSREAAYIHALAFSLLTNRELLDPSGNHVSIDLLQTHLEEQQ